MVQLSCYHPITLRGRYEITEQLILIFFIETATGKDQTPLFYHNRSQLIEKKHSKSNKQKLLLSYDLFF